MPWNDNANPGPWGAPPAQEEQRRPEPERRLPPPSPPPPAGPDWRDYWRRARGEWRRLAGGSVARRWRGRAAVSAALAIVAGWLLSGFYLVPNGETAIVSRLGAYARSEPPGWRYRWPSPIETVDILDLANDRMAVGGGDAPMLTADGDLAAVRYAVRWRVADPIAFTFAVRDGDHLVRQTAASVVRAVVGQTDLAALAAGGRAQVQARSAADLQRLLKRFGVTVDELRIKSVESPADVEPAAQDVAKAAIDGQAAIAAAQANSVKALAAAAGQAGRITRAAEADREKRVHEANGEASKFDQILVQYRRAPETLRRRLYIETMERVFSHAHVIVAGKGVTVQIAAPPPTGVPPAAGHSAPPQAPGPSL